ncbi:hypothetical protein ACFQX6_29565 [Streptosporangium lutulentum]
MVDRRPDTRMVELNTDHFVYANDPSGFAKAVNEFLAELQADACPPLVGGVTAPSGLGDAGPPGVL